MAAIVNDRDVLLESGPRKVLTASSDLLVIPGTSTFHVSVDGVHSPDVITIKLTPVGVDGPFTFAPQGCTLTNITATTADVTYSSMTGPTAIISATAANGGAPVTRSCILGVIKDGAVGTVSYTWVKYADSAVGAGLSDDPAGKSYIGLAYNKPTATESTTPADYAWSLIKGTDGVPGAKGADGVQLYTWIKYADYVTGEGMYDTPNNNTLYIGLATNKFTSTESNTPADYTWSRFKGEQGVPGPALYTWIKYADDAVGTNLTDDPTGKSYIGFAYNKPTAVESTTPTDYTWSLNQGGQGVPGPKGTDGQTLYTWIKYADVSDGTGLYDVPSASTQYIGIGVNKTSATESTLKTDYVWSKFKGDQGVPGPALYTWIKYADSANGAGLTDDPTGKAYIGFAYNKLTATEGTDPTEYTWSLNQGGQGVPGQPGKDGTTFYTWIKYSDSADGTGLYDVPNASTVYIGIAVNKPSATESNTPSDYTWSRFRGADGVSVKGDPGTRGAGQYYATGNGWTDSAAESATPGASVAGDVVTISNGSTFALTKKYDGSVWQPMGAIYDGSLFVTGSINGAALKAGTVEIRDSQGRLLLGVGDFDATSGGVAGAVDRASTTSTWNGVTGAGKPSDNASSDVVLVGRNVTVAGNTLTKTGGTFGSWDADAYSVDSFTGGAYAAALVVDTSHSIMFGLNSDPLTDSNFASIDYAIYLDAGSNPPAIRIYENGSVPSGNTGTTTYGTPATGDIFAVAYDGSSVKYLQNGAVFYTSVLPTSKAPNQKLFFDSSIAHTGGTLKNVRFGPLSSNNWNSIGGTGKPSDFATAGAADAATSFGFNPQFSNWDNTAYPAGWAAWSGPQPAKETSNVRTSPYAVRWTVSGNTGMVTSTFTFPTPLPAGTFVEGAYDINILGNAGGGSPGYLIRLFTNSALNDFDDTYVPVLDKTVTGWQRVPFSARTTSGTRRIYAIQVYQMASYNNMPGGSWANGSICIFDNLTFDISAASSDPQGLVPSITDASKTALWTNIVGQTNAPANNATVGAPSGTLVGNTLAQTVESNAAAGAAASTALSNKLNKSAADILSGQITVSTGGAVQVGTAAWTGTSATGTGIVISPKGIAGVNAGKVGFSITSSGDAAFGGQLTAASGTFSTLNVNAGGYISTPNYTSYNWPTDGSTGFWLGPEGLLLGNGRGQQWFLVNAKGEIDAPGFSLKLGQLTLTNPIIVTPNISGGSVSGTTTLPKPTTTGTSPINSSGANGSRSWSISVTPSGGSGAYTYSWSLGGATDPGYKLTGSTTSQSVNVSAGGSNTQIIAQPQCVVTDSNGLSTLFTTSISATFGTPA
jgi:hypothetical protein